MVDEDVEDRESTGPGEGPEAQGKAANNVRHGFQGSAAWGSTEEMDRLGQRQGRKCQVGQRMPGTHSHLWV